MFFFYCLPGIYLPGYCSANGLMPENGEKFHLNTSWRRSTWKVWAIAAARCKVYCCLRFFVCVGRLLINVSLGHSGTSQSRDIMVGGCGFWRFLSQMRVEGVTEGIIYKRAWVVNYLIKIKKWWECRIIPSCTWNMDSFRQTYKADYVVAREMVYCLLP